MNQSDAFKILGLSGNVTPEEIKLAYRRACAAYHPDRNPAGLEMMKLVNAAYEAIQDFTGEAKVTQEQAQYGSEVSAALNQIALLNGLIIEICGSWVWVTGNTKIYREQLKAAGFKWAPKKQAWHFRPESEKSFSRGKLSLEEIRERYGSCSVDANAGRFLAEA